MVGRVPEVCHVIAYKVVRSVEIDRKRILLRVVYSASDAYYSVFTRLKREVITVSRELPYCLDYWYIIREDVLSCRRILGYEVVGSCRIIRRESSEAETIQILHLIVVVVKDEILVCLIIALLRKLLAAAAIEFLDDYRARLRI